MPSPSSLRSHDSPKDSDRDTRSSPHVKRRSPKSPNKSGNSSSHSYRDQSSIFEDDPDYSYDSQEEDEVDSSYPSTNLSPTTSTPSPRKPIKQIKTKGSQQEFQTPPSGKKMYPDLSSMADKTSSSRKETAAHSSERQKKIPLKSKKSGPNTDFTLYIVVAIIVIVLALVFMTGSSPKKPTKTSEFQDFVAKVDSLQTTFKSQEKRTWRSIKSSVKHILNGTDPEYPAVVMFAVKKEHHTLGSCLARRVASLFNSITGNGIADGYLDARLMSHLESAKQKEDLDEKIHSNFKTGRSVVIDHLEALSPLASLLLHGICDNDNAPFKNVFIGIVFNVDKTLKVPDVDRELENYFSKELDMDKIGALLTRINNNAVIVTAEDNFDSSVCESF